MATVATLTIDLIANSARLNRDLRKSSRDAKNWADATRRQVNVAGKAFGGLAVGGVAALGAIYVKSAESADALAKMSDKIGILPERLTALQHAGEQTGVSVETTNMALQRMVRRVSEAGRGSGEAVAALKELGLNAERLAEQSPDEQFKSIAGAMESAGTQADRVRLAMKLFDSEGVALVNTLALGRDGLSAMEAEAEALGITMSRIDLAKIEAANDSFDRANKVTTAFGKALASELAPFVGAIGDEFTDAAKEAGGFGQVAVNIVSATAEGVGIAADAVHGLNATWKAGHVAVSQYVDFAINNWAKMDSAITAFLNKIPGVEARESEFLQGMATSMAGEAERVLAEFNELAMAPMPSENIKEWVEDVRAKAQAAAEEVAASRGGNILGTVTGAGGDAGELAAETDRIVQAQRNRFARIHEEMLIADGRLIELEQFRKERADLELEADLERIRKKGLLTEELEAQFRKAREQADAVHQKRLQKLEANKYAHLTKMGDDFIGMAMRGQEDLRSGTRRILLQAVADHIKAKTVESKASGIAAIQQAWASAPFPYNIPSVLITTGKTLALTAAVQALTPSFDGGGYTGSGARVGGLDGKGGFMAMLHPQETVVDHSKGQSLAGGAMVQLNLSVVNELGVAANAEVEQSGDEIRLILRAVDAHLNNQLNSQTGVARTMRQVFGLSVAGTY